MVNTSKAADRILWWWFAGTKGGPTRVRIVMALKEEPLNAKQLADTLGMNYKTVRHHLRILSENHLLVMFGERYGRAYSLSPELEASFDQFVKGQQSRVSRNIVRVLG